MFLLLTNKSSFFNPVKENFSNQFGAWKVLGESIKDYSKEIKTNTVASIMVILDMVSLNENFCKEIYSTGYPNVYIVCLVEKMTLTQVSHLIEKGVKKFHAKKKIFDENFLSTLAIGWELFCDEQEETKLRAALDKQLIIEYNKTTSLLNSLSFGVVVMTPGVGDIGYVFQDTNKEINNLLEFEINSLVGKPIEDILASKKVPKELKELFQAKLSIIKEKETLLLEFNGIEKKFLKRTISPFKDRKQEIIGYVWIFVDVTSEVEKGFLDPLTGLHNRRYLDKNIVNELYKMYNFHIEQLESVIVMMIDIDNFKIINDNYGHPMGDHVIKSMGLILAKLVPSPFFTVRYGGEEFTIVMQNQDRIEAERIADKILDTVRIYQFDTQFNITVSLGICYEKQIQKKEILSPNDMHSNLNKLISNADDALYQAKNQGKDKYCIY